MRKAILLLLLFIPCTASEHTYKVSELDRLAAKIIMCESSCRHEGVYGDHGKAYGIAQFHRPTFNEFKKRAGRPDLKYKSEQDQIWLLKWALRNGLENHWTCYKKVKG